MANTNSIWRISTAVGVFMAAMATSAFGASGRPDAYDLTLFKFKGDVAYEAGKRAAEDLNAVLKKQDGFEKRHLYFDKEKGIWIDQVKWKHVDAAKRGREALQKEAPQQKLEQLMDPASVQRFRSERLFEIGS